MRIEDVMTQNVMTCCETDSASEAARIMWERDCGCVPVVDDEGRAIGMVTDRDLLMASYTRGLDLREIEVRSVMSRDVQACHRQDDVQDAEYRMAQAQVRRLPVIDGARRVVGLVSLGDLARARQRTPAGRVAEHVLSDVAKTLAAIVEPRRSPGGAHP
jgi:CBS domain-containing protein